MSTKLKSIISIAIVCIIFIWVLPAIGFLPMISEYVHNRTLFGIYGTIIAFILVCIMAKAEDENKSELGMSWQSGTLIRFVKGLLIGLVIACLMIFILTASTEYSIVSNSEVNINKAILGLLGFIPLALMEEIIFRGYPFMKLKKVFGLRITQVVMAILFAYYHDRTGATLHLQLMGPGIWALIYGIAAVWSKGIALPTGIHAAANMVLALVGTKHEDYALWNLEVGPEIIESAEPKIMFVNYAMALALLVIGIASTEWWCRKYEKK